MTKFANGKEGDWKLAVLIARPKPTVIYTMRRQKYNMGPTAYNNFAFSDITKLKIAVKSEVMGRWANGNKRNYRTPVVAESLPLPTSVPE